MNFERVWDLLKTTFKEWQDDEASLLAAALSYYTAVSVAPLLVVAIVVAGLFLNNQESARTELLQQIESAVGPQGTEFIAGVIENADQPSTGTIAGLLSIATLLWASTNLFSQLQTSLNKIWDVERKPGSILSTIRERFFSFSLVLGIGFLLLVSLVLSAALTVLGDSFSHLLPGAAWLWQVVNFAVSFGVITLLFGLIYKILPDAEIAWRDVWLGAAVTALLFTVGKSLLGLYLANAGSSYGAAGSLVVFLLWVYYSAQILFMGAEFTQVYASKYGSGIKPAANAISTNQEVHSAA